MKLIGKGGLSRAVEILLLVLLFVAPVIMATLPWTIPLISQKYPGGEGHFYEKYMVILALSGILAECILWQARGLMGNVNQGKAFSADTVRRLKVIGIECLTLGGMYAVALLFVTKIFTVAVLVTFVVVGMILLVFSELFRQAVAYKEENDMTI